MESGEKQLVASGLDAYDIRILAALANNADISASQLAVDVHLSRPAVVRRINILREKGICGSARVGVDFRALGFEVAAEIQIIAPTKHSFELRDAFLERPEVLSLSIVVGTELMILDVIALNNDHLHRFLNWMPEYVESETRVILSKHESRLALDERIRRIEKFLSTPTDRLI